MRAASSIALQLLFILLSSSALQARVVVFSQSGFPTVDSQPVAKDTLTSALGTGAAFADLHALTQPDALQHADLLVLPYGSAVPVSAWPAIERYLQSGGNLLVIGGQPLHVPVRGAAAPFTQERPQDAFARRLDLRHTYAIPVAPGARFRWRDGYDFLPGVSVHARRFFAVEGRLDGLGYMFDSDGTRLAAPVIVSDRTGGGAPGVIRSGARIVALDFDPQPGFWESSDGIALIRAAAGYAQHGATSFTVETKYTALRPGEAPDLTVHLRSQSAASTGEARVELLSGAKTIAAVTVPLAGANADAPILLHPALPLGFYTVRATYSVDNQPRESSSNGFFVEDPAALNSGPALSVDKDFLTLGGQPFLPVGTNYFTTEENGWDFSGPRNALVWDNDFADMERHGVSWVRTGVWMSNASLLDPATGGVTERFLRNLEAYLAAAQRHHIVVNFTFFAFSPHRPAQAHGDEQNLSGPVLPNPYLDPATVRAEQQYVLSIVRRFAHVPWLSWDLINEPSFSNPYRIFHGNLPNGDPVELAAWQHWLATKYGSIGKLAEAWNVTPTQLGSFDHIPLPADKDLSYSRYGNPDEVRAFDYNLFAQDEFADWVRGLVEAIHSAGSTQLINVGQDEGGVTDRLLNQFYATAGVSFTTNHTYWQDDALLWDSVAAKRPGMPNITGETGYQPVWQPDGAWRYDELTGLGLTERKWALGFAAGSSGAVQWDWAREVDFGMQRSDGSAKLWEAMMRELGQFAKSAAPYMSGLELPSVAIVLPQSLQLSVLSHEALEAQQTAVRVLFQYNRVAAFAVGEYQIGTLGHPKLIVLPSAYGLSDSAWQAIEARVRDGAVLLVSGPFDGDPHLHATRRAADLGLYDQTAPLTLRDNRLTLPGASGPLPLTYSGSKTTSLDRAALPDGRTFTEILLGKGRILFSAFPLELNDNLSTIAAVYAYALQAAQVNPAFTTTLQDPGILICPTRLAHATLYVLTSETDQTNISFTDRRSEKSFSGQLEPGRASLLLIGEKGNLLASYRWH